MKNIKKSFLYTFSLYMIINFVVIAIQVDRISVPQIIFASTLTGTVLALADLLESIFSINRKLYNQKKRQIQILNKIETKYLEKIYEKYSGPVNRNFKKYEAILGKKVFEEISSSDNVIDDKLIECYISNLKTQDEKEKIREFIGIINEAIKTEKEDVHDSHELGKIDNYIAKKSKKEDSIVSGIISIGILLFLLIATYGNNLIIENNYVSNLFTIMGFLFVIVKMAIEDTVKDVYFERNRKFLNHIKEIEENDK